MTEVSRLIKVHIQELQAAEKAVNEKLKQCPEGTLQVSKGRYTKYYRHKSNGREYLRKNETPLIKALEEKYYLEKLIQTIEEEKEFYSKIQDEMSKMKTAENLFLSVSVEKRHLIKPFDFTSANEQEIRKFENNPYCRKVDSTYKTLNGKKVRSKSELIIADRLSAFGIPYQYEPSTMMDEYIVDIWYPDFMTMNKRTGAVFYWEHFGMLDDAKYRQGFLYKLERYPEEGFYIGENLIISTESAAHPLNTENVDRLIKHYLL